MGNGYNGSSTSKSEWDKRNPLKNKAKQMVNNSVRAGKLHKRPCEICGNMNVHAHHDDYSKPLNVRWLCPKHHAEHHIKLREKELLDGKSY